MRTAPPGTGIIAGGPMRAVFEMLGVAGRGGEVAGVAEPLQHDPRHHRRPAELETSPRMVAQRRGKKVADILPKAADAARPKRREA